VEDIKRAAAEMVARRSPAAGGVAAGPALKPHGMRRGIGFQEWIGCGGDYFSSAAGLSFAAEAMPSIAVKTNGVMR